MEALDVMAIKVIMEERARGMYLLFVYFHMIVDVTNLRIM